VGYDPALAYALVRARSLARGLPDPVPDHGGLRVDTRSEDEQARWVFAEACSGIGELGQTITEPGYLLKLFAPPGELMALLPSRWQAQPERWFMAKTAAAKAVCLPDRYSARLTRAKQVSHVQIMASDGTLAAEGYAAETAQAFVYDRIMTAEAHRLRGLGSCIIQMLGERCSDPRTAHLLVATAPGRALYERRGWKVLCPYATAGVASPE
jgi:hypothetical protein